MTESFYCPNCKKPTHGKDGIEGDGSPYFITCYTCEKQYELQNFEGKSDGPLLLDIVGELKHRP